MYRNWNNLLLPRVSVNIHSTITSSHSNNPFNLANKEQELLWSSDFIFYVCTKKKKAVYFLNPFKKNKLTEMFGGSLYAKA